MTWRDGLACVAFDGRHLVHREDRKVDLEAGLRSVRIVEVDRLDLHRLARPDGVGNRFRHALSLRSAAACCFGHVYAPSVRESSMNGTATSRSERPPCATARRARSLIGSAPSTASNARTAY
jgi:hypothetical protein